jgi:hypothetical protein
MNTLSLTLFALLWFAILYLFNSLIAREFKKIDPKQAIAYFMAVALIGIFGELFLDTIYNYFVGQPLWRYNILPIHHAYTSSYAIVIWGLYGFHLYLLHGSLNSKWSIYKTKHLVLLFGFEALVIESLLTISARLLLGDFMYYYTPGDLWHVTSIQNLPFYLICGVIVLKTLKRFKKDPVFLSLMSAFLLFTVVFLV